MDKHKTTKVHRLYSATGDIGSLNFYNGVQHCDTFNNLVLSFMMVTSTWSIKKELPQHFHHSSNLSPAHHQPHLLRCQQSFHRPHQNTRVEKSK